MNPARHHCQTDRLLAVFRHACRPPARDDDGALSTLEAHFVAALDAARDESKPAAVRLRQLRLRLRLALKF